MNTAPMNQKDSGLSAILARKPEELIFRMGNELKPDAIILDIDMPGQSGFEVFKNLKQDPATANIPIIINTSKMLGNHERSLLTDAIAILSKESASREISIAQFAEAFRQAGIQIAAHPSKEAQNA